jgi:hypothetical protein
MPKTTPKPQLTAVTALNPWCCPADGRIGIKCARCQLPALAAKDIPAGLADPGYVRAAGVRAFGW